MAFWDTLGFNEYFNIDNQAAFYLGFNNIIIIDVWSLVYPDKASLGLVFKNSTIIF